MCTLPTDLDWNELKNVECFASGGNSLIYKALFNETIVIVKTVKSSAKVKLPSVEELEKELRILSKLNHPNIVKLYGAGYNDQGYRFLVLEWLGGGTLGQMISKRKEKQSRNITRKFSNKVCIEDAISDAYAIARALEYCHQNIDEVIIVHRDLKPDNIG